MAIEQQDITAPKHETDWRHLTPDIVFFCVVLVLVVLVPLWMSLGMYDAFDLPKWTIIYLSGLTLMGAWFFKIMRQEEIKIYRTPLDLPMITLLVVMVLSTFQSLDKVESVYGVYRFYSFGLIATAFTFLNYWLAVQFLSSRESLEKRLGCNVFGIVLDCACFAGSLVALYGILQYFGIKIFIRMPSAEGTRIWSTLGNPLYLGAYLAMLIPVSIHRLMRSVGAKFHSLAFTSLLMLVCLILTLARGAWLGLIVATIFYAGVSWRKESSLKMPIIVLSALLLSLLLIAPARERALTTFREDLTNLGRIEGWKIGMKVLEKRPFLGTGPDTFGIAFRKNKTLDYMRYQGQGVIQAHAHNDIVQWAVTTGLMGLSAYIWIWISIFRLPRSGLGLPLISSLVVLFIQNQFNFATAATLSLFSVFLAITVISPEEENLKYLKFRNPFSPSVSQFMSSILVALLCIVAYTFVKPVLADYAFQDARALMGNDPLMAVDQFDSTIKLNSRVPIYINELGNLYKNVANTSPDIQLRQQLIRKAIENYQINLNLHPYDADCYSNMGVALMWMNQLGEDHREMAWKCFDMATQLDPTFSEFWAYKARVAHFLGNIPLEIQLWQKVLELDPKNNSANNLLPGLMERMNEHGEFQKK